MTATGFDEGRISPGARSVLAQLTESLQQEVVREALRRNALYGGIDTVSATDVVAAFEDVIASERLRSSRSPKQRYQRVLGAYAVAGVALSLTGMLTVLLLGLVNTSRPSEVIAAVAGIGGALLAAASSFLLASSRASRVTLGGISFETSSDKESALAGDFLREWLRVEVAARNAVGRVLGEEASQRPLSKIMDDLIGTGILDEDYQEAFRSALLTRNRLVHTGEPPLPPDLRSGLRSLDVLASRLERAAERQLHHRRP